MAGDSSITPARDAALDALSRVRKGAAADEALAQVFASRPKMIAADKGLAQELAYGVLRWRRRLDDALHPHCKTGLPKDAGLLDVLRMGAHQLLFLGDRMAPAIAVSATVDAAKARSKHGASFVNAVLRALSAKPPREPASIAVRTSFSDWMVKAVEESAGRDALPDALDAMNRRPPLVLRARPGFAEKLRAADVAFEPGQHAADAIRPEWKGSITEIPGFAEGAFTVQDEAAQLVTLLLEPQGDLLDVCAAPGGKAIHAAHLGARVTAIDADPKRLALVNEAAKRLSATLDTILAEVNDAPVAALGKRTFARVLVDAPCSATGIIRRKPDVKWARKPGDVERLSKKQLAILRGASHHVARGGRLVYAVCSFVRLEGEDVVAKFLGEAPEFKLAELPARFAAFRTRDGHFRSWPHLHDADGFFAAVMERHS